MDEPAEEASRDLMGWEGCSVSQVLRARDLIHLRRNCTRARGARSARFEERGEKRATHALMVRTTVMKIR